MKKSAFGIWVLFFILMASCTKNSADTSNLYVPTSADTTSNATLSQLQEGRLLYIDNCGNCHGLHSPDEFSSSQWTSVMANMAPRTNLNATQIELVKKYISRGKL